MTTNPYTAPLELNHPPEPPSLAFDFKSMLVMSMVLSGIGFVFGLLGSLFLSDASWPMRLVLAGIPAFCAFVASCLLFLRDYFGMKFTLRSVHRELRSRADMSFEHFSSKLPEHDPDVLAALRDSVARFFHVPASKIFPDDDFATDFRVTSTDPVLQHFIVASILQSLNIADVNSPFNPYSANSFSEFASLTETLLDR